MAEKNLDPMITAALAHLVEVGGKWNENDRDRWLALWGEIIAMVYPAKKPRKSRAKVKGVAIET